MHSGETNERTGIYQAFCCKTEVRIVRGAVYPRCPSCDNPAIWSMVRLRNRPLKMLDAMASTSGGERERATRMHRSAA